MRKIELLAPAKNLEIAKEAILHGADAVYIGAPRFGARAAAGNSIDEIRKLVGFAHVYGVRVYVTLNTILYDKELQDMQTMAVELAAIGVDAFIVQDMAFMKMKLPPVSLHASTQMDNRTADKVGWLLDLGFQQAVLARELTLDEIREIHEAVPDMLLEVFVHGATCVSYNGQCYASQYCFGRSANRGECAQFCRLPFDLVDGEGHIVNDQRTGRPVQQQHLLSLRDMNRADELEDLLDAGVSSFKIEGRLKDVGYVKNVTAYYRQRIDEIIARRSSEFQRASVGATSINFTPQLERTFNRGFSTYFLHGRESNMVQLCSPKSTGQFVGHVKEVRRNCFTVSGTIPLANGDGLCFVDAHGRLQGVRVNRVENNCLYPKEMPEGLSSRTRLYRNYDQLFTQQLSHPSAQRRIAVEWTLAECVDKQEAKTNEPVESMDGGITLQMRCSDGVAVKRSFPMLLSPARTPQYDNIVRQLSRLGDTPFFCDRVEVQFSRDWFIPSSTLAEWRRCMADLLLKKRLNCYVKPEPSQLSSAQKHVDGPLTYRSNVANRLARCFYEEQGATSIEPAFEVQAKESCDSQPIVLMTMRYCPKYELGLCGKYSGPLFLRSADGRQFPLRFECKHCLVKVLSHIS